MGRGDQVTKDTRVDLVEELRKLKETEGVKLMIEEALAGEYHDFKNNKYNCGKVEVAEKLRKEGTIQALELRRRVISGEFDERADEEDKEHLRSITNPRLWRAMGIEKKP